MPVYLDGDTEQGQKYAARFGVMGYPTFVVFDPSGREITRIPGGVDLESYTTVLGLTLSDVRPVVDLLRSVASGESLASADCQLLAYYSWGQDNEGILDQYEARALFPTLRAACPPEFAVERSRLFMEYLITIAEEPESGRPVPLHDKEQLLALAGFNDLLADYAMVKANIESFLSNVADITRILTAPETTQREELLDRVGQVLAHIKQDESLPKRERIYASRARVRLEQIDSTDALEWYERAYHESKGPATRFQWGYNYLTGLLELSPEDEKRIEVETVRVFQELENIASNAFYQRTRVRLEQLEESFAEWNKDGGRSASIAVIRAGVMKVCQRIPIEDESRQTCEAFLESV